MKNFRSVIILLTFIAAIINYLDRTALSYAIIPIQKTFGLNNAEFGLIASSFGIGYMIMTLGGGIIVDKFGAHRTWSITAICWSIVCALLGAASGFWMFFLLRLLLGLAEGPAFPALNRVVADWVPWHRSSFALAVGLSAVPFASVIGAPLISHLILITGWRIMFVILGCLGVIWAIVWYKLYSDQPQKSLYITQEELSSIEAEKTPISFSSATSWKFMLSNPSLLANYYAFFSFGYLLFFSITWLPAYFQQVYHLNLKSISVFLIAPWLLATLLILAGGYLSDWLLSKTCRLRIARSHLIWICQVISALCFIPVIAIHSLTISLVFISLAIGIGLMPNAAFFALNIDLTSHREATSLGIMECAFAISGILSPLLTGFLTHLTSNYTAAFILLGAFILSSALGIILFQHPDKT